MKIIVSVSPESRLSTFSGKKSGNNSDNLLFPILVSYRNLI